MKIDEKLWAFFQNRLGFSDEDMEKFKKDPRNRAIVEKGADLAGKTIVAEVVHSSGCNSEHRVGDKFFMDATGNLISKLCPTKMCIFAIGALQPLVYAATEMIYAGVDPNRMLFKRCGCIDVGLQCGGWGRIVMELRIVDRNR